MRRIDKSKILSTKYKKWLDKLEKDKKKHPPKSRTYYYDVVMNLLYCQKGLCAYTEMSLSDERFFSEKNWENGQYKIEKPGISGELEHFNPDLKKEYYWKWDNLFFCHHKANRLKSNQEVDDILKPDSPGYDPMELLEYDVAYNVFRPHSNITDESLKLRIQKMIDVLQLNFDFFCDERRKYFTKMRVKNNLHRTFEPYQFLTAYQMIINQEIECGEEW